MAVGSVNEELKLVALPEGLTFTVTELKNNSHQDWRAFFEGSKKPPYQVAVGATIADAHLTTASVVDKGAGLSCTLRFTISGAINGREVQRKGYFVFSATDWPLVGRPDYSILSFQLEGTESVTISQSVPTLLRPDPYHCAFVVKDDELFLIASCESNLGTSVTSKVVGGIITAHTKALGWVFGKIW